MSNPEQFVSTAVGATIGFFVGGPAGALAGAQYGLLAGSVLFPADLPGIQGPRLEDFERLNANPGSPIPIVWGVAAVTGFPLYLGPVTELSTTEEVGGKGGPSQDVTTFHYYQTIAIGLCEGPISGITRIWENGKLVYDTRLQQPDESDAEYNARVQMSEQYEQNFVLYLGDEEQLPDPTLESELGEGNVPGFRGLAYIVFPHRELKDDQAKRHPVFKIEVVGRGELVLTSQPYPIEVLEELESIGDAIRAMPSFRYPIDIAESFGDIVSGTLEASLITYDGYEPEAIDSAGDLMSGEISEIAPPLITYEIEPEAIDSAGDLMSGEIADVLIRYDGYEAEAIDSAGDVISGELS